ncbi:unnamed protein product [Acanthoscelides obtectus]|uniref:Uncharacterized protein n=1 Tax=Acanthoscelides obtectus TaxID=200917 RepID=A0A9P0KS23_ACAOB|nr:unnamed protein product [Acanthoscelides obtectus]CAK1678245.1 Actin-binding protein IPP [Acanthoscelides obtectus]
MYSLYRAWLSFGPGSSPLQPPPPLPPIQPAPGAPSTLTSSLPTSQQLNLAAVAAAATAAAAAVQLPPIVSGAPDVTLQVGPNMTHFSAHKAVLSVHSGYFKAALTHSNESSTPISVPNVNVDEFSSLLTFMYTGYLDLNISNIYSILLATHILHMPRALEICRSFLLHSQTAAAAAVALESRVNVIKPIPSKKIPPITQEIHPPAFGRLNKSEDTPFRTVGNNAESSEQKKEASSESAMKVNYINSDKPVTKSEKKPQERRTKKRLESSSCEKVIVDIACCDGPVKFHRVVNKNYGLQPPISEPYEKDDINNRNVAMNKAMNENIRDQQLGDENENLQQNNEIFTCLYCNHTFKSQYCYQKHARRHLNPVSLEAKSGGSSTELKREVKLLDMNVQYYPCKICGSKFPSYYFVHKHRKMCHSEDVDNKNNETVLQNATENTDSSSCSAIDVEAINNDK